MARRLFALLCLTALAASPLFAQGAATPLSLDDAEKRALDRNAQIADARLGTEAADYTVAQARAAYGLSFSSALTQRSQVSPATSQLSGGDRITNTTTSYESGLTQPLWWGGGRLSLDFTGNRAATSNLFSSYNPSFTSALTASYTQPLLRGFTTDANRLQLSEAQISRAIADTQVRQAEATTLAAVRRAYWELVYSVDALETARRSQTLAQRQVDENKVRLELGTVAQIDVLQSEAEVASRQQDVVLAEGNWRTAQTTLKQLIVRDASDPLWSSTIEPSDRPVYETRPIDVAAAVRAATANRTDLDAARRQRAGTSVTLEYLKDQRKPAVDLVVGYTLSGIGGTQILRSDGALGSTVTGTVPGGYLDVLRSIGTFDYPAWTAGINVSVPIGTSAADAAYARGKVEQRQADTRIGALELQVAADVTRAADRVRSTGEQVDASKVARDLAQRKLEAEQARLAVGLSTTFLVLQAQRDLATAETSALRALLDYRTALVDFDLVQVAG